MGHWAWGIGNRECVKNNKLFVSQRLQHIKQLREPGLFIYLLEIVNYYAQCPIPNALFPTPNS